MTTTAATTATDFETNLRTALAADQMQNRRAKRLFRILDARPSRRRTRQIARMERHVEASLIDEDRPLVLRGSKIDWSKVDWRAWLPTIISLLLALLPFLI